MFQLDGSGRKYVFSLILVLALALVQIQQFDNTAADFLLIRESYEKQNTRSSESELQWSMLYSAILRGGYTRTADMTVDSEGNTYFTGEVESSLFPTIDAYDSSFNGEYDCFVMKFDRYGTLVYSTFIGGSDTDRGTAIEVDDLGNIYVAGNTFSTDFPVVNANQSENNGNWDCFVLKLNPSGSSVLFSTYFGGSSTDTLEDIAVDSEGNVFATGYTVSSDFPTVNALDDSKSSEHDCFVFKLNSSGDSINFSTYVGANGYDNAHSISIDTEGCAYVSGRTTSTSFPTVNPLFDGHAGFQKNDCFLFKLNSTGNGLDCSTYIGGTDQDQFSLVKLDLENNIYVVGNTRSSDFPRTLGFYDDTHNGEADVFVMKINTSLNLVYSTFIGGSNYDFVDAFDLDADGNVFIVGNTMSANYPLVHELQSFVGGATDVYVCILTLNGTELEFATPIGGSHYDYPSGISVDTSGIITITGNTQSLDFPFDHYISDYPLLGESSFFAKIGEDYPAITETTSSSTSTNITPPPLDFGLLSIISIGGIATIFIVVVVIIRNRNKM